MNLNEYGFCTYIYFGGDIKRKYPIANRILNGHTLDEYISEHFLVDRDWRVLINGVRIHFCFMWHKHGKDTAPSFLENKNIITEVSSKDKQMVEKTLDMIGTQRRSNEFI